ncbi:MAG TPA: glycosyltransferase family 39 protein [Planctomycetota bacterium]|nr:glycosyltransferase family 39 protein [Planctomycetota bacterium]
MPGIAAPPAPTPPPADSRVQIATFVAALLAIRCALAAMIEPTTVECYYWLYGNHPQLGYFDHPGVVGWTIWLSRTLFGDGALGFRVVSILLGGLTIWLSFLAGRRLYGERAGRRAAILAGLAPLLFLLETRAMPDGPLLCFWAATVWALAHALSGDRPAWWMAAGLFAGLAMDSKYQGIFLPLGVLGFLAFSPDHRGWLRRREPYLAAVLALLAFAPTLAWNARNGWQSLAFQGIERLEARPGQSWKRFWGFPVSHLLLITPVVCAAAWGSGVVALRRWRSVRWQDRLMVSMGLPILLFFLAVVFVRPVKDHWAAAGYLALLLLASASPRWESGWSRRLLVATVAVLGVGSLALPVVVPFLPGDFVHGWRGLAEEVRRHEPAFVLAPEYTVASAMAYQARPIPACDYTAVGLPGRAFAGWWRAEEFAGKTAVIVLETAHYSRDVEPLKGAFDVLEGPYEVVLQRTGGKPTSWSLLVGRGYHPEAAAASADRPLRRRP